MIEKIETAGDARVFCFEIAMQIRDGGLSATEGQAAVAAMKVGAEYLGHEINAQRLALAAGKEVHHLGKLLLSKPDDAQ